MKLAPNNPDVEQSYSADDVYYIAPEGIYRRTDNADTRIVVLVREGNRCVLAFNSEILELVTNASSLGGTRYIPTKEQLHIRAQP